MTHCIIKTYSNIYFIPWFTNPDEGREEKEIAGEKMKDKQTEGRRTESMYKRRYKQIKRR